MHTFIRDLPPGALLFVIVGWLDGFFAGGLVAALIARAHSFRFAGVIGPVFLIAAVATLFMLPHPLWFIITAVLGIPFAAFLAGVVARRFARQSIETKT